MTRVFFLSLLLLLVKNTYTHKLQRVDVDLNWIATIDVVYSVWVRELTLRQLQQWVPCYKKLNTQLTSTVSCYISIIIMIYVLLKSSSEALCGHEYIKNQLLIIHIFKVKYIK